jgi:hypothetical protein
MIFAIHVAGLIMPLVACIFKELGDLLRPPRDEVRMRDRFELADNNFEGTDAGGVDFAKVIGESDHVISFEGLDCAGVLIREDMLLLESVGTDEEAVEEADTV